MFQRKESTTPEWYGWFCICALFRSVFHQYTIPFVFPFCAIERKGAKESPLKREVQAVKSILQGGSSSMRDQPQSHHESQSHHSKEKVHRHTRDDKAKHKKRNIFEVFKKPTNATETDPKPVKQQRDVIDKFGLECIEILKVNSCHCALELLNRTFMMDFRLLLQHLKIPDNAKKQLTYLISMLETVIKKKYLNSNITELSESVQNSYLTFSDFINSADSEFANVSSELIEQIIDFFEKVVMTRNHKYVCVLVFLPNTMITICYFHIYRTKTEYYFHRRSPMMKRKMLSFTREFVSCPG